MAVSGRWSPLRAWHPVQNRFVTQWCIAKHRNGGGQQWWTKPPGCLALVAWAGLFGIQVLKYDKRLTPLTGAGLGRRGKKGAKGEVTKRKRGKEGLKWGGAALS